MKKEENKQKDKEQQKEARKLLHKRKKVIINDLMMRLSDQNPDLYYRPTVDIAQFIWEAIKGDACGLRASDKEIVQELTQRDIQILLGHHSDTTDHLL